MYAPDLFEGDPAPADMLVDGRPFDIQAWFGKHSPEHTGKRVRAVIAALKEQGVTEFGATGYCYGGMF